MTDQLRNPSWFAVPTYDVSHFGPDVLQLE